MRITLVSSSLSMGGSERVLSIMANYWAAKGWKITLLTFDNGIIPPFYELDSHIRYIPLGIARNSPNLIAASWNNLMRIHILRRAIRNSKPNAVISFIDKNNVITLLATRGLKVPVLVSERTDPTMHSIGKVWNILRLWTYSGADRVVVQSQATRAYFSQKIQSRTTIIPNPVLLPPQCKNPFDKLLAKSSIITMGRFDRVKGFDLLIQAFAQFKEHYPEWTLTILGDGPLRSELESLRDKLGLTNHINLLGPVKNPYQFLQQADLFVMSSHYEGFPNALLEAMACGLPVISTDCSSGPREIIRDGIDGILVPPEDVGALAAAMARLISDKDERKRLAFHAVEVNERFGLKKVMGMWEELLNQMVSRR